MITVQAPEQLFPTLYDDTPKAIVIGQELVNEVCAGERLPVRILGVSLTDTNDMLWLEELAVPYSGGSPRRLPVPPANVWCVVLGEDDAVAHTADRLISWWREAGGVEGAPHTCSDVSSRLERCLLDRAVSELAEARGRNASLLRSLSALRDEWASTARIPPEITELLDNLRLSAPRQMFASSMLEGETVVPVTLGSHNSPSGVLVQPLPAWSRGIIGIDLHVATGVGGGGTLWVSLYAVDGDCVLAKWRVLFADLRRGWLPLRIPAALNRSFRAIELRLSGDGFGSPRLSTASTGLFDQFAMKILPKAAPCRETSPSHMLAMRVWGALPGTQWDLSKSAPPLSRELAVPVPDDIVAQVQPTRDFPASFRWFDALSNGRVLLHPLHNRIVAARIPLFATSTLRAVNCEVAIEDPRRQTPIACKLVIAVPETTDDQAENEDHILASSGWVVLPHSQQSYPLSAILNRTFFGAVNLHLFTKIADEGPDYYGRTVFGRFELMIDGEEAWQMPPILSSNDDEIG